MIHELLGKMKRGFGSYRHLPQQRWSFLNLSTSNKGNNSAISQGIMNHILNISVQKKIAEDNNEISEML